MTTIASLLKRVERIEAKRHVGAPTKVLSFRPLQPGEVTEALRDWREWVADGRAKLQWGALVIPVRELTVEEWEAETAKYRGEPVH